MQTGSLSTRVFSGLSLTLSLFLSSQARAQTLINVDFGAGSTSPKTGFAATGQGTNDFWNRYRHYEPKFAPGMRLVSNGRLESLKLADGSPSEASITVTNAPGVWGNATADPMFDSYIFAPNGSNIVVTLTGLQPGQYHFYLYGHADADVSAEQNSLFTVRSSTNRFGPLGAAGVTGWQAGQPWRERGNYLVFRDVPVTRAEPVTIEVAPGPGGIAVLNGLQVLSRGTAPPRLLVPETPLVRGAITNLLIHEVHYDGKLSTNGARFTVAIEAESRSTNEVSAVVFEGDVAVLSPKLPPNWRLLAQDRKFYLFASAPGAHRVEMQLAAKVQRAEPWNQVAFIGPPAAIATVSAEADVADADIQLQSGTPLVGNGLNKSLVRGVLGSDQRLAVRWQSKTAEVKREALVAVDSKIMAYVSPAVIRYVSQFRYEIHQGRVSELQFRLPADHALTKLEGEQVRDWQIKSEGPQQLLTVEFIRPVEHAVTLALTTEQAVTSLPFTVDFVPPAPAGAQRESGAFSLNAEDVVARVETTVGMRQVNAAPGETFAFRFNGRPASVRAQLTRLEPVINIASRVTALLEENRLLLRHDLGVNAARAGIYNLEMTLQPGFTVAEVTGAGVEDWKMSEGRLHVSFGQRVLGDHKLTIHLERALTNTPPEILVVPLRISGAAKETAFLGAGSTPGLQMKTRTLEGAREIPITALPDRKDELLAFRAEQGNWRVTLAAERLAPRMAAEIFNLLTIGDGVVGGSATLRYGIANQGVQQFRVRLPAHWRNVEFTGPNLRRKDKQDDVWTISLQDKAWEGYTLVITYDFAFDPKKATLNAAGAHALDVERENGTLAIATAAGLAIESSPAVEPLRLIDPAELADADRALITRPVLLAYRYEGSNFAHALNVTRHSEVQVLDAIADRAQLTSVLTESGEMLTQASFMVKNNERQFQRFQLPAGAALWGVTVNGEAVKADRDGDWLLVSLPRTANRNQAFAVDLKYAQQLGALGRLLPRKLEFVAPKTDVPGTYAEWEVFVPPAKRISGFHGNMTVARGTTYSFRDAWQEFLRVYQGLWHEYGAALIVGGGLVLFLVALVLWGRRRGFQGVVAVLGVFCVLAILGGMLLPALSKAKSKAQRIKSVNNLKNVGLAARIFATDHEGRLPNNFEEMLTELGTDKILFDPETGERYTYVGAGKSENDPNGILAYSSDKNGRREVVMTDGTVQQVTAKVFAELLAKEAAAKPGGPGALVDPTLAARYGLVPKLQSDQPQAITALPAAPAAQAGFGGGGAIGGGVNPGTPAAPTTAGIRSLKIEIPRTGRALQFTRVLNLSGEPPKIRVSFMSAKAFAVTQMAFQLSAFLVGLGIVCFQWRRAEPRALWVAVGAGLALVATADLFIAWRALHLVLIVAVPGFALALLAWLIWRSQQGRTGGAGGEQSSTPPTLSPVPPATAVLLLSLFPVFQDTWAAETGSTPQPDPVSIVSATYSGHTRERVAQLDATFELVSAKTNATVLLFGREVAIQEFSAIAGNVRLWREGERVGVLLPDSGSASVKMKLLVKLGEEGGRRRLEFGLPAALGSRLLLSLDEPDAEIEFPSAVMVERTVRDTQTRVEAVLGMADRVLLSWTPRLKQANEIAATTFVQQASLATFGAGLLATRSVFNYQVTQGELRQLRLALPSGHRLLRVSGDLVRSWDFSDSNRTEVTIDLLKGASPSTRLTVETESALDQIPGAVRVLLPRPLDVKRATGVVAIRSSDELGLTTERVAGLERMESLEFLRLFGDVNLVSARETRARLEANEKSILLSVWRFLRPDFELGVRAEMLQPRVEAIVRNQFSVGLEQVNISSHVDYTISRAGIFAVRLVLPLEVRLDAIKCDAMQTWTERNEGATHIVEINLKQRMLGQLALDLSLVRALTNLPPTLELAGVHALGSEKMTGFIAVSAEPGVAIKTSALAGLTEIPAHGLPGLTEPYAGLLAFKYLSADPQSAAPWKLTISTESVESWVRAEVASFVTVGETLVSGRTMVRYDIQNAPAKEFRLKIPPAWRNVEILGPGIRRRDQTNDQWRVELQNKVRGEYRLTVQWEHPRALGTNELGITGVEALNVERETGVLSLQAHASLQLTPKQMSDDLVRLDAREWPDWTKERERTAGAAADTAALTFRYLRPGWRLTVDVQRFNEAALLQALVENARLRTVVADDGQLMTHMELTLRNNGRQHLEVTLPTGAKVWSAFVSGQAVRPAQRGEQLLLPLERLSEDAAIPVDITYVNNGRFPRNRGKVELASPRFDAPLKDARWELFLPPDYEYQDFGGTMSYERADLAPLAHDFTFAEYARQEVAKESSLEAEALDFVRKARSEIAAGKLNEAGKRLSFFRSRSVRDAATARELKQLEEDVNRAQSSNLINAQQALTFENAARFGADGPAAPSSDRKKTAAPYDTREAEKQLAQLQKAQAVAVVRVTPLRVNLPTRGLRHSFVQVLQTEVNKPLTITLSAANDRQIGWIRTVFLWAGGFLALWLIAVVALNFRPQRTGSA